MLHELKPCPFCGGDAEYGEVGGEGDSGGTRNRHLCRAVDGKVRGNAPDHPANPEVLDDGGIHSRSDDGSEVTLSVSQLVREHEGVESHIPTNPPMVQEFHEGGQVGLREIVSPHAGVEALESEVDRIRPVLYRRARALPVAGGSQ